MLFFVHIVEFGSWEFELLRSEAIPDS